MKERRSHGVANARAHAGKVREPAGSLRKDYRVSEEQETPFRPWGRSALFAIFAVSGFAGLIYESIWAHYLKLFLGHAAYAQTLVLAIFMGGMAVGSWLVSRFTQRVGNLLMGYAFAELGIGLLAIAFHGVFVAATR